MATPEGVVKDHLKKELSMIAVFPFTEAVATYKREEVINGYFFMPAATGMGEAGVADLVLCIFGQYVEIEVKADKEPTDLQALHGKIINAALGQWFVVRNKEEVDRLISVIKMMIIRLQTAYHLSQVQQEQEIMNEKDMGTTH